MTTADPPVNPFAGADVGALYARGRPFHHPRSLARVCAIVGAEAASSVDRAVDLACGTGMSTVALGEFVPFVVGVDVAPEMLGAARHAPGVTYLRAHAERLPLPDASFGAVTCCSGVHWFEQGRVFAEVKRVLQRDGWVGLYDHYFIGEMVDVPEFAAWTRTLFERFPLPARNAMVGDPGAETPAGFDKVGDEFFADDIDMSHAELVDYQLTLSNFVAAAERGVTRAELRAWLFESLAPLFAGAPTRTLRFLGSITCLRPLP